MKIILILILIFDYFIIWLGAVEEETEEAESWSCQKWLLTENISQVNQYDVFVYVVLCFAPPHPQFQCWCTFRALCLGTLSEKIFRKLDDKFFRNIEIGGGGCRRVLHNSCAQVTSTRAKSCPEFTCEIFSDNCLKAPQKKQQRERGQKQFPFSEHFFLLIKKKIQFGGQTTFQIPRHRTVPQKLRQLSNVLANLLFLGS